MCLNLTNPFKIETKITLPYDLKKSLDELQTKKQPYSEMSFILGYLNKCTSMGGYVLPEDTSTSIFHLWFSCCGVEFGMGNFLSKSLGKSKDVRVDDGQ